MREPGYKNLVGILGGGQLGLFLAQSLARLGAHTAVFDPDSQAPALRHTAKPFSAPFSDHKRLLEFAEQAQVITYEFEHLPVNFLAGLGEQVAKIRPSLRVLEVSQDRLIEKNFLKDTGFPVVPFLELKEGADLDKLFAFPLPILVKTVRGGYDGKGQTRLNTPEQLERFLPRLKEKLSAGEVLVAEQVVELHCELSCIVGRKANNCYLMPVFENVHKDSILDTTVFPAQISEALRSEVEELSRAIATALDVQGLLTVEYFIVKETSGLKVYVNELAPRPHNSGHLSMQAFNISQFDLLARLLLDLPVGKIEPLSNACFAMANILGDCYHDKQLHWQALAEAEGLVEILLYGKEEPRPARKMGHLVTTGATVEQALSRARALRLALSAH
jgi:5-(carboxyamino)imidazole ribonucleotide synthase